MVNSKYFLLISVFLISLSISGNANCEKIKTEAVNKPAAETKSEKETEDDLEGKNL